MPVKGSVVLILIAASLAVSVALQSSKTTSGSADDNEIERISKAMAGVAPLIPEGSAISFRGEPGQYAPYIQARYLLAPRAMNIPAADTNPDTLLAIQYIYSGDSALQHVVDSRRLVWEQKDDRYRYTLTVKN